MSSPEQLQNSPEQGVESQESASGEQLEKPKNSVENTVELSPRDLEAQAERARTEALRSAVSVEVGGKKIEKEKHRQNVARRGAISKKERNESYKKTMKRVQSELKPGERLFSKVIHNKAVDVTSDFIGNTIARPNAILSGSVVAFVFTLIMYVTAKNIGYALSGFETILAFIVGWLVGIIYDYFRVMITGKKS